MTSQNFSYAYYNSGKLASVVDNRSGGFTSTYGYDLNGNRTFEAYQDDLGAYHERPTPISVFLQPPLCAITA